MLLGKAKLVPKQDLSHCELLRSGHKIGRPGHAGLGSTSENPLGWVLFRFRRNNNRRAIDWRSNPWIDLPASFYKYRLLFISKCILDIALFKCKKRIFFCSL
jgi:hypothetical protein